MDLIDQPGLKEKKRARNAALPKTRGPAVKERNSGPLADHERQNDGGEKDNHSDSRDDFSLSLRRLEAEDFPDLLLRR